MEINDRNFEHLTKLGLTEEIFENNLKKWYKENRDISADFENDKVLIDKINTSNQVANVFEMLKNNFLSNGYDLDGFNQLVSEQTRLTKINFDDTLKLLPDDFRAEFLSDLETESKQKLVEIKKSLFNDLKTNILKSENVFAKNIKPLVITKNEFIQKITKAEILAEETFEVSIHQDLFLIEKQKINEEHSNKLIIKYYADTINNYNNVTNLYKASNDQFAFLYNQANSKLTDEDRIDFIATVLFGYLTDIDDKNNKYDVVETKEIFSQLKNIDTLIYETKLLELKVAVIKKYINDTENEFKEKDNSSIENKNILVDETENDFLKSTIEEHLEEFEDDIMHNGYKILVDALYQYFSCNKFPVLKSKIKFKSINKKRVGWALKELYKCEKRENLDIEYFRFAQENINLFANEIIEKENFYRSNFYKMFTTNPAK